MLQKRRSYSFRQRVQGPKAAEPSLTSTAILMPRSSLNSCKRQRNKAAKDDATQYLKDVYWTASIRDAHNDDYKIDCEWWHVPGFYGTSMKQLLIDGDLAVHDHIMFNHFKYRAFSQWFKEKGQQFKVEVDDGQYVEDESDGKT